MRYNLHDAKNLVNFYNKQNREGNTAEAYSNSQGDACVRINNSKGKEVGDFSAYSFMLIVERL